MKIPQILKSGLMMLFGILAQSVPIGSWTVKLVNPKKQEPCKSNGLTMDQRWNHGQNLTLKLEIYFWNQKHTISYIKNKEHSSYQLCCHSWHSWSHPRPQHDGWETQQKVPQAQSHSQGLLQRSLVSLPYGAWVNWGKAPNIFLALQMWCPSLYLQEDNLEERRSVLSRRS